MVHWFQMYHDDQHYEGFPDHEFGFALFEKFRVELGLYKSGSSNIYGHFVFVGNPLRMQLQKIVYAFKNNIMDLHYFVDDATYYDNDVEVPAKDRCLSMRFLRHAQLEIRLDTVPVYIYNVTEDGKMPEKINLIDRLNLLINPDYLGDSTGQTES